MQIGNFTQKGTTVSKTVLATAVAAALTFGAADASAQTRGTATRAEVQAIETQMQALMERLRQGTSRQVLVGTWAAATWAIRFYDRNGFRMVAEDAKALLLKTYWTIPERQVAVSVVLAAPALTPEQARALVIQARAS